MDFLLSLAVYFLPFLFAFVTSSLHQMHMFQLNSYSGVKHCRWMKKNISAIFTNILSVILWFVWCYTPFWYVPLIAFVLFGIINIPRKKAKKPPRWEKQ